MLPTTSGKGGLLKQLPITVCENYPLSAMSNASRNFYDALKETYETEWTGYTEVVSAVEVVYNRQCSSQRRLKLNANTASWRGNFHTSSICVVYYTLLSDEYLLLNIVHRCFVSGRR